MPYTPFHLGPALLISSLLGKRIHTPTLLLSSVILDLEPLTVLLLGIDYPLHGYAHTILGSMAIGAGLALSSMWFFDAMGSPYRDPGDYLRAGMIGTVKHVLLDSPLYHDIRPLWPLTFNPLLGLGLGPLIYSFCIYSFMVGIAIYLLRLAIRFVRSRA